MPILRSTRSHKISNKNNTENEIENKVTTESKQQQRSKQKTRDSTKSSSRRALKEINSGLSKSSEKSVTRKQKSHNMVNEEELASKVEDHVAEVKETEAMVEEERHHEKDINAETSGQEEATEKPEAMDVAEEQPGVNEDVSPPKKQKLESDDAEQEQPNGQEEPTETKLEQEAAEAKPQENLEKPAVSVNKTNSISLKSQTNKINDKNESSSRPVSNMPEQLLTVLSNLYLNVGERLHLNFLPRCLDDLAYCHRNHYHSDLPEAPIPSQAHSLKSALQHYRYVSFINSTIDMCHRGEFPGKGIFTKIIELVLSINYNTKPQNVLIFQQSYHKSIELFSMIVRTFPPCWHKIRTYYVGFLEYGLDHAKLGNQKDEPLTKSSKIFDIILDLLEEVLKTATLEELSISNSESLQMPLTLPQENAPSDVTSPQQNSMDLSVCSEYWNQNEYEERERQKQTFTALSKSQKIERIFMCLRLLLEILEYDLAMWMLHHFKKTKEWIFCTDNRPLIVVLCELTQYTRMTRVARRIFSVYSESAAKGLCKRRLQVLQRYISLIMIASNIADMENTAIGVKYPYLGDQTKTLIKEFFKIFKVHNLEEIPKYMETIELLRVPYVRFEFIDNVLFTNTEPLTPQKIAQDMAKKRWLKYKPRSELAKPNDDISREQYLHLLLDALRQYCNWHGSKTFLHVITDCAQITHLSTTNDSVHRWPTHGSGVLVLKKMTKDIKQLETKLKMSVRMSKPKVNISLADICIDEALILKYRNDLKFVISLQNVLLKQKEMYPEVDFTEWLEYLNDFSPMKIAKEPTQQEEADEEKTTP